ncbi:hypothetical protein QYE76_070558 [Lolium multiflorum]|uniref:Uncharacterized protein n=1 Tax=Lolium multiflorum TaxID=4521 RepID=A0AAD8SK03_LOLMU|nr:hypothetical protein QYE76_070558 [Lolium multiflorum]
MALWPSVRPFLSGHFTTFVTGAYQFLLETAKEKQSAQSYGSEEVSMNEFGNVLYCINTRFSCITMLLKEPCLSPERPLKPVENPTVPTGTARPLLSYCCLGVLLRICEFSKAIQLFGNLTVQAAVDWWPETTRYLGPICWGALVDVFDAAVAVAVVHQKEIKAERGSPVQPAARKAEKQSAIGAPPGFPQSQGGHLRRRWMGKKSQVALSAMALRH